MSSIEERYPYVPLTGDVRETIERAEKELFGGGEKKSPFEWILWAAACGIRNRGPKKMTRRAKRK